MANEPAAWNGNNNDTQRPPSPPRQQLQKPPRPKIYDCPHCTRSFDRPSLLAQHILIHTGERPHLCPKCDEKRFSRTSNLYRHLRTCKGPPGGAGSSTNTPQIVASNSPIDQPFEDRLRATDARVRSGVGASYLQSGSPSFPPSPVGLYKVGSGVQRLPSGNIISPPILNSLHLTDRNHERRHTVPSIPPVEAARSNYLRDHPNHVVPSSNFIDHSSLPISQRSYYSNPAFEHRTSASSTNLDSRYGHPSETLDIAASPHNDYKSRSMDTLSSQRDAGAWQTTGVAGFSGGHTSFDRESINMRSPHQQQHTNHPADSTPYPIQYQQPHSYHHPQPQYPYSDPSPHLLQTNTSHSASFHREDQDSTTRNSASSPPSITAHPRSNFQNLSSDYDDTSEFQSRPTASRQFSAQRQYSSTYAMSSASQHDSRAYSFSNSQTADRPFSSAVGDWSGTPQATRTPMEPSANFSHLDSTGSGVYRSHPVYRRDQSRSEYERKVGEQYDSEGGYSARSRSAWPPDVSRKSESGSST